MIGKLVQAAIRVALGLAVGGASCTPKTAAPAKKPAAADYQAAVPPPPPAANIRAICYNDADLATLRGRMLQQELSVATLQCQTAGGSRAYDEPYRSFLAKYSADLSANFRTLQQVAGRRRLNVDVVVTEFANRTAQKAPVDPEFCTR